MSAPATTARLHGLDALRGLAVFLMIEQHMGVWLWRGRQPGETLLDHWPLVAFNALGGGAAPMFITLAGVGTSLLLVHRSGPGIDVLLVRRGLVLLAFGLLLNLITPSWFSWGSWFVLHLMGFAMALAPLWRRMSDRALIVTAVIVAVAAIALQMQLDTPMRLTNERMRDTSHPGGALRLALVESQFPIFPWLAPYLLGTVAGRWIHARRFAAISALGFGALLVGLVGWLVSRQLANVELVARAFAIHLGFFPASIAIVALLVGAVLLVIAAVARRDDRRPLSGRNPLVALGRISLTLLLVHVPLFRQATRPIGWWQALTAGQALATIAIFLVLCVVIARAWERFGYRFGAEWLLRKLAG
ncbi:MAG TPA: DUF418 domain-containing transporter [Nannocystaceae bacterium]|nr:DUF418 domain-containing transporter [Nannocystaceae bacterium]